LRGGRRDNGELIVKLGDVPLVIFPEPGQTKVAASQLDVLVKTKGACRIEVELGKPKPGKLVMTTEKAEGPADATMKRIQMNADKLRGKWQSIVIDLKKYLGVESCEIERVTLCMPEGLL
jgi:hypothetical protein